MSKRNSIWTYIRNYRFNSIFFRNLLTLLLLELIPVSVALYLGYTSFTRLYESETLRQHETALTAFMTRADQILNDTSRQLASLSLSKDVELFLYADPEDTVERTRVMNIQQLQRMQIMGTPYMKTVYVYASRSNQVILHSAIVPQEDFRDRAMIQQYLLQKDEMRYPKVLASMDYNDVRPKMRLSVFYDIYFGDGQKGVAIANIDPDALRENLESDTERAFYILGNGQVLYAPQTAMVGADSQTLSGLFDELTVGVHEDHGHRYAVRVSEETGLTYIAVFPEMTYPAEMRLYRTGLQTLLLVLVILSCYLCVLVSVKMYRPIEAILMKFNSEAATDIKGMDELKYIVHTIEQTISDKSRMEQELEKRVALVRKAQSIALQAQINPHFINNTLQTINSLAMLRLGASNEVSGMVNALSGMLSISLENTSHIIPLQQEIAHCMLYLEIQEKRYRDRFDVTWDIPQELRQLKTIKIILQPIVENCIYHAIKPLSSKGHIAISAQAQEDTLIIKVQDDGLGMDPAQLEELNHTLRSESIRESKHLGIANVNQRIRLYFGDAYGVQIESRVCFGTTVILRIPRIN